MNFFTKNPNLKEREKKKSFWGEMANGGDGSRVSKVLFY